MCIEKLRLLLEGDSQNIPTQLFAYGHACGLAFYMDLDCIRVALAEHPFSSRQKAALIKELHDGFLSGSNSGTRKALN